MRARQVRARAGQREWTRLPPLPVPGKVEVIEIEEVDAVVAKNAIRNGTCVFRRQ